jgi:hypothetical protein
MSNKAIQRFVEEFLGNESLKIPMFVKLAFFETGWAFDEWFF